MTSPNHFVLMKLLQLFIIMTVILSSSCTTVNLWKKDNKRYYSEEIKNFLISQDGKKIIFIGKEYHYVIEDESNLIKKLLAWNGRMKLTIGSASDFHLGRFNSIKVRLGISTKDDYDLIDNKLSSLTKEEMDFLKEFGFSEIKLENGEMLTKTIELHGQRYLPKLGVNYDLKTSSLSQVYKIRVYYDTIADDMTKAALTPITITADGIMIIASTPMVIIFMGPPFVHFYISCIFTSKSCDDKIKIF